MHLVRSGGNRPNFDVPTAVAALRKGLARLAPGRRHPYNTLVAYYEVFVGRG